MKVLALSSALVLSQICWRTHVSTIYSIREVTSLWLHAAHACKRTNCDTSSPIQIVQIDQLEFVYSRTSPPEIHNDTISISLRQATDHRIKMAISHALAQSSKLSVYEKRILSLVEEVRLCYFEDGWNVYAQALAQGALHPWNSSNFSAGLLQSVQC